MIAENNQKIEQSIEFLLSMKTNGLKQEVQEEVIYEINAAVTTLESVEEILNEEENYIHETVDV